MIKDGIVVSKITEGDKQKFIVKLDENTNNSIKNSLSKTEAENSCKIRCIKFRWWK